MELKIHIPEYIQDKDLCNFTELFLLIPFIESKWYNEVCKNMNWWNDGLFTKLFFNCRGLIKTSIDSCDVVYLPFKYNSEDWRVDEICGQAKLHNKRVVAFYNDDNMEIFKLPENLILFRSSTCRNTIQKNERIFPALVADHSNVNELGLIKYDKGVGFCGHYEGVRERIINKMQEVLPNNCNFIKRNGFYHSSDRVNANTKRQYYKNIAENRYTLCMRGAGNFSYRFYETLSLGRIPILISSDDILPFNDLIEWEKYIIRVSEVDIIHLKDMIEQCKISPESVRNLWVNYFSPEGYSTNFIKEI